MIDWFVLLVPVLLLPIVLLFVFVGCFIDRGRSSGSLRVIVQIPRATFIAHPPTTRENFSARMQVVFSDTGQLNDGDRTDEPTTGFDADPIEYVLRLWIVQPVRGATGHARVSVSAYDGTTSSSRGARLEDCTFEVPSLTSDSSWSPPEITFSVVVTEMGFPHSFYLEYVSGCD
jgi:hypothetical protein